MEATILSKENYMPKASSWKVADELYPVSSIIIDKNEYGLSYYCNDESAGIQAKIRNQAIAGKTVELGFSEFSSDDNDVWLYVRLYTDSRNYTEIISEHNFVGPSGKFEIEMPSEFYELRVRFRHDWASSVSTTITVHDAYLRIVEIDDCINFHKVSQTNLPKSVTPGSEHIYIVGNNTKAKMYVSAKDGSLVGISGIDEAMTDDEINAAFTGVFGV